MFKRWHGVLWVIACACSSGVAAKPAVTGDAADATADAPAADSGQPAETASVADLPVLSLQFCEGPTKLLYDPPAGQQVTTFPDDFYTQADGKSLTGLRVHFDVAQPWIAQAPPIQKRTFIDLNELDGFGTTAAISLRFSAAIAGNGVDLPSGPTSAAAAGVQLVDLGPVGGQGTAIKVPFETQLLDNQRTALLWPMVPLQPKHRHALIWTTAQKAADGQCIAPSPYLRGILQNSGASPKEKELAARAHAALKLAGVAPQEVSALALFTTQSTIDQSVAIAKDIAARQFDWAGPATCTDSALFRKCDRQFVAADYTDGRVVADGKPQKNWTLTATLWLPKTGKGPFATALYGHGLGSGRSQGEALAELSVPVGVATVAIDALCHGDHPTADPVAKGTLPTLLRFFAIDLATISVDGLKLRDHWRQSTYDKLQFIQLLRQHPDFDGDGAPDIDGQKLLYLGVSLGGIMGSELLALSPDLHLGVLAVPGARVASIISDSSQFAPLIGTMKPDGVSDDDVQRFFPLLQTLLDAGDSAAYAGHVIHDRLPGAGAAPHLLMQMAIGDEIVPNSCNRALARALGIAHGPPIAQKVGVIAELASLPASANAADGRTAVLFQFDRVSDGPGSKPEPAGHGSVPKCAEAQAQDLQFLQSWLKGGPPVVIDPYALLKTPPLPKN